jgi:NADPH:quinone reductase-like Zn-dependent oxidoreductase
MRAIGQDELGGPEVLKEISTVRPEPGPSEVLVRVKAAGLNPTDWVHRSNPGFLGDGPHRRVLGWELSGVVEEVGTGVTLHRVGDEVFGMLPYPHGHGALAEYAKSPARALVRKPEVLDHTQAAAVPLAALTAWQALVDTADVQPGQRVLVHAAAGGVGHFAVQIAKARGAYVIGTASAGKHDLLRELGADELIDYRSTEFEKVTGDIDVVLDAIGRDYVPRSFDVLKKGGIVVSIALRYAGSFGEQAAERGVRHELMLVEADQQGMKEIADLIRAGSLRPVVEEVFPFTEAAKAHERGESGRVTGKLVVTVP